MMCVLTQKQKSERKFNGGLRAASQPATQRERETLYVFLFCVVVVVDTRGRGRTPDDV